jgi:hypothetical protein
MTAERTRQQAGARRSQVVQAVPELGGQLGFVEVPDPARIIIRPAPLEPSILRR